MKIIGADFMEGVSSKSTLTNGDFLLQYQRDLCWQWWICECRDLIFCHDEFIIVCCSEICVIQLVGSGQLEGLAEILALTTSERGCEGKSAMNRFPAQCKFHSLVYLMYSFTILYDPCMGKRGDSNHPFAVVKEFTSSDEPFFIKIISVDKPPSSP